MNRKSLSVALLALVGVLLLPVPAEARRVRRSPPPRPFTRGFEISTYLVHVGFESEVEIDDDVGFGFRFGYLWTPHHGLDVLFHGVSTEDAVFPAIGVDVTHFQAAYVYNFTQSEFVPYLTAGLGFIETDDDALGSETDAVLGFGGGIRFFMNPVTHFRLEARFNRFEGDGKVYIDGEDRTIREISFGIGWRFPTR